MNNELRRRYIRDLLEDLVQVGGANLEQFLKPLWDQLAGSDVQAHGLNPLGSPVAGALDSVWPDGSVSEASSEKGYFTRPFTKIAKDVRHVLRAAPHVRVIHLFSTQVAGPAATTIERHRESWLGRGYTLDVWDGRRIAEHIVDNLLIDERYVERVGSALPNLRRIAEQNAASQRVPELDPLYGGREEETAELITRLKETKCVEQAASNNEEELAMGDFKDILTDLVIEGQNGHNKIADQLLKDELIFPTMQGMLASMVYNAFTGARK